MKTLQTILFSTSFITGFAQPGQTSFSFDGNDTNVVHYFIIDTITYRHNLWQIGTPHKSVFDSAISYPNALMTDTLLPCRVNDTSVVTLKIPAVMPFVPGSTWYGPISSLQFHYRLDIDTSDLALIEIAVDSQTNWLRMPDSLPQGYYFHTDTFLQSPAKTLYWASLSIPVYDRPHSDTMFMRFTFISGSDTAARDGWMMDDFLMHYAFEAVPTISENNFLNIYPNPSTGSVYLQSDDIDEVSILIYDLNGKQVWHQEHIHPNSHLNLTLPDGVYVLKYRSNRRVAIKRLIIQR